MKRSARLPPLLLAGTLASTTAALALDTPAIVASVASPDCLQYRVVGICYWLYCTLSGCSVRTSLKVRHYVPDAVVASYSNTGENPWQALRTLSPATSMAHSGGAGTSGEAHENNLALFKNADVIGHPGAAALGQYTGQFGYTCSGAGTPFKPYLLSTLDTLAWRYGVPERAYPEAVSPGLREIGTRAQANLWAPSIPVPALCIKPMTTRAPPLSPNAQAISSHARDSPTSTSRCGRSRNRVTGPPARSKRAMARPVGGSPWRLDFRPPAWCSRMTKQDRRRPKATMPGRCGAPMPAVSARARCC